MALSQASRGSQLAPRIRSRALSQLLVHHVNGGKVRHDQRQRIAEWARCLGANAGADYVVEILDHMDGLTPRPTAP